MDTEQTFRFLERRAEKAGRSQNLGRAELGCLRLAKGIVVSLKFNHGHDLMLMRYFRGSTVALFRVSGSELVDEWVRGIVPKVMHFSWFPIREADSCIQDFVSDLVNEALHTKNLGLDAFSQNGIDDIMLVDQNESYDEIMIAEDLAAADDLSFL